MFLFRASELRIGASALEHWHRIRIRIRQTVLAIMLSLLLSTAMAATDDSYHLGAGDKLRVTVYGEQDLSGNFAVDTEGKLTLPLIGSVDAAGIGTAQLEERIEHELADGFLKHPRVAVEVLNFRPFYILGEVKAPGSYDYSGGLNVLSAVARAGGFTYRARISRIVISRVINGKRVELPALDDSPILPDDVIQVPERFF